MISKHAYHLLLLSKVQILESSASLEEDQIHHQHNQYYNHLSSIAYLFIYKIIFFFDSLLILYLENTSLIIQTYIKNF